VIDWVGVKQAADPLWNPEPNVPPVYNKWVPRPASGFHTFGRGDNLMGIADRYGVSHRRLALANPTLSPNSIREGTRVNIPMNEREWLMKTKGFDPEAVSALPANFAKAVRMQESQDGKYLRPFGNASSARGIYQMLRDRFNITKSRHPEMKTWNHDDLLTDNRKAQQAFDWTIKDNMRRYNYLNGTPMPVNMMIRSWHQPGNLYNQRAIDYEKAVMKQMELILQAAQNNQVTKLK